MATKTWAPAGGVPSSWNTAASWSPVGIPTAADDVVFRSDAPGTNGDCVITNSPINCLSFTINANYSGNISNTTNTVNIGTGGFSSATNGGVVFGNGATWNDAGNWIWNATTGATRNFNGATFNLTGAGKNLTGSFGGFPGQAYTVNISGSYTLTNNGGPIGNATVHNSGTVTIPGGITWFGPFDFQNEVGGLVTGAGLFSFGSGTSFTEQAGTINVATLSLSTDGTLSAAGTFDCGVLLFDGVGQANWLGDAVMTGNVQVFVNTANKIIARSGTTEIRGNLFLRPDTVWSGTDPITLGGTSGTQTINAPTTVPLPPIIVNCPGATKQLTGNLNCASVTHTNGTFDPNGRTITTTGNFTITTPAQWIATGLNGSTITVGGNFNVAGASGALLAWLATAAWVLDVTGTAVASFVEVARSNAASGTGILASNSTNGGNNTNWHFVSAFRRPFMGIILDQLERGG